MKHLWKSAAAVLAVAALLAAVWALPLRAVRRADEQRLAAVYTYEPDPDMPTADMSAYPLARILYLDSAYLGGEKASWEEYAGWLNEAGSQQLAYWLTDWAGLLAPEWTGAADAVFAESLREAPAYYAHYASSFATSAGARMVDISWGGGESLYAAPRLIAASFTLSPPDSQPVLLHIEFSAPAGAAQTAGAQDILENYLAALGLDGLGDWQYSAAPAEPMYEAGSSQQNAYAYSPSALLLAQATELYSPTASEADIAQGEAPSLEIFYLTASVSYMTAEQASEFLEEAGAA